MYILYFFYRYGQTSSGKTYTMEGPDIKNLNDVTDGIIPRIFRDLSDCINNRQQNYSYKVTMSMIEIYMEKVTNLFDTRHGHLAIRGDSKQGFYPAELMPVLVTDETDMIKHYQIGCKNRTTAATNMNDRSSRSHSLLILNIEKRDEIIGETYKSVFNLVDLAGSEKFDAAGDDPKLRKQAEMINKSLSTLGLVIKQLSDNIRNKKGEHVSFRNSVLTQLLMQSLVGNCLTSLILCCSPAMCNKNV